MDGKERGATGTSGGILEFVLGVAMAIGGAYLLTNRVTVRTGHSSAWGGSTFILTLLPLIAGVGMLFFGGRPRLAKLLIFGGATLVLVAVVANMRIHFRPTTLFETLVMLFLLAAGIGLIARSLRPARAG
jgi:hypothetical protein